MVAASVGAAVVALVLAPTLPGTLASSHKASSIGVAQQSFDDARNVDLSITKPRDLSLTVAMAGRITADQCVAGNTIESGSSLLAIDGQPLLSLSTGVPLWRDLRAGDTGSDVRALQGELARLGYPVNADGRLGPTSISAVQALLHGIGDSDLDEDKVPSDRILWIPSPSTQLLDCSASLAATISQGEKIAMVAGGPASAKISTIPSDLVPGARQLTIGDQSVDVNPDGTLTATDALALAVKSAANDSSNAAQDSANSAPDSSAPVGTGSQTVRAKLVLKEGAQVSVLPPSTLYDVTGSKACVSAEGSGIRVRIAGSELGRTFVIFDGDPPKRVEISPQSRPPCQ